MTKNRFSALGLGAGVTAVIQSSSATTVMVVGFVNAGLMSLTQAINVGIGANIGTTITAQIVAPQGDAVCTDRPFCGRGYHAVREETFGTAHRRDHWRPWYPAFRHGTDVGGGRSVAGVPAFIDLLSSFQNPWIGLAAGLAVTAIIQSSSATMGIIQAFAMQGVMGLDSAVYVILGLNIGTCVTAILASISGTKTAKRTAVALLFFNIIGAFIFMVAMRFFAHCGLDQIVDARLACQPARQLPYLL